MLKYKNISEIPRAVKRARDFEVTLPYQGINYWIEISFDYGKFCYFSLENKETGERRYISYKDERLHDGAWNVSLEEFLHHDKVLDEEISYTLPEKLLETKDSYNIGRVGRLFCRNEKEKYGRYGIYSRPLWNGTGGLVKAGLTYREGALDVRMPSTNGEPDSSDRRTALGSGVREFRGGKLQRIDGCENMTSLQGLVYTGDAIIPRSIKWYDQKEARKLTEKEMKETLSRKLWLVCVMDGKNLGKERSVGYVFFFDAERYTKKQMIALAKSVHLK